MGRDLISRTQKSRTCLLLACGIVTGLAGSSAWAQSLDQFISPFIGGVGNEAGVTVLSRQRTDYESGGIRSGSFIIRPLLIESAGYQSNVLGTSRPRGSPVLETNGSLEVTSDVSRVGLTAALTVDDVRYFDQPRQSYTNWTARIGGSYEIGRDVASLQYSHLKLTQTLRDLDVPEGLQESLSYDIDAARLSYRANFSRLFLTPALDVAKYTFGSGSTTNNVRQDFRNRVLVTPSIAVGYELAPRRNAIFVVRDSIASYSNQVAGQPKRDYNDFTVLAGFDYDATGLVRFRALVGYEVRTFNSSAFKTIQAPVAEASAIWTPTGLTTVTGSVIRRIQDSADESTSGYTETSARLRVDHEYLRNVLLQANAGVYYNEYNGGGNQTLYTIGAGATYLLNRNMGVTATYDFVARPSSGSSGAGQQFTTSGQPFSTVGQPFSTVGQPFGGTGSQFGPVGQRFGSDSGYVDNRILIQLRLSL